MYLLSSCNIPYHPPNTNLDFSALFSDISTLEHDGLRSGYAQWREPFYQHTALI